MRPASAPAPENDIVKPSLQFATVRPLTPDSPPDSPPAPAPAPSESSSCMGLERGNQTWLSIIEGVYIETQEYNNVTHCLKYAIL